MSADFTGCARRGRTTETLTTDPGRPRQPAIDLRQRHVARGLALNCLDDVAALDLRFVRRPARNHRDHRRVAVALGKRRANAGLAFLARFVFLELGGIQIAGVCVQRLQQPMQRAVGDRRDVRLLDILVADARQHLAVDAELAIGIVVIGVGLNAELANHDKRGNQKGKSKNNKLRGLRHCM